MSFTWREMAMALPAGWNGREQWACGGPTKDEDCGKTRDDCGKTKHDDDKTKEGCAGSRDVGGRYGLTLLQAELRGALEPRPPV